MATRAFYLVIHQTTLLSKLFDCDSYEDVLTTGYQNALLYIIQTIDRLMNGEVQITNLVISKLLRQNIERYKALFPHVAAAIRLNVSGVITNRGDSIQYVYTDSNHADPLQRITPAKLASSESYDKEKYLAMLLEQKQYYLYLDSIGRYLDLIKRKIIIGGMRFIINMREILSRQKQNYKDKSVLMSLFPDEDVLTKENET